MVEKKSGKRVILPLLSLGLTFGILYWLIEIIARISDGIHTTTDLISVLFGCIILFILPFFFRGSRQENTRRSTATSIDEIRREKRLRRNFNLFKPSIKVNSTQSIVKKCMHCKFENPAHAKKCMNCFKDLNFDF